MPMDKQRIAELVQEIESIEEASIQLFTQVPLEPAERLDGDDGEIIVLRWFPDDAASKISRDIRRRYEQWYHSSLKLIDEFLPYQERDFRAVFDVMISYITLNRYAATSADVLGDVQTKFGRGYIDIYLNEFAGVIDSQADLLRSILQLPDSGPVPTYRCFLTGIPCINPLRENPHLVFVIMPFDVSYDDRYQIGIKETVKSLGLQCQRADEIIHTQNIICRAICQPIRAARYVIAEVTERNPNVFYELGLTHGRAEDPDQANKRVILLTQNVAETPFDLRNMNLVEYDTVGSLRTKLRAMLIGLMTQFEGESA
jgi:hypothetical protein